MFVHSHQPGIHRMAGQVQLAGITRSLRGSCVSHRADLAVIDYDGLIGSRRLRRSHRSRARARAQSPDR